MFTFLTSFQVFLQSTWLWSGRAETCSPFEAISCCTINIGVPDGGLYYLEQTECAASCKSVKIVAADPWNTASQSFMSFWLKIDASHFDFKRTSCSFVLTRFNSPQWFHRHIKHSNTAVQHLALIHRLPGKYVNNW